MRTVEVREARSHGSRSHIGGTCPTPRPLFRRWPLPPLEPQHRNSVDFARLLARPPATRSATPSATARDNATQPRNRGPSDCGPVIRQCHPSLWFQYSSPAGVPGAEKRRLPPAWRETGRGAGPHRSCPSGRDRIDTRAPRQAGRRASPELRACAGARGRARLRRGLAPRSRI
jgi:hypothetical protein